MKTPGLARARALALGLVLTLTSACALFGGGPGTIKVSEVAPLVTDIADRHDAYAMADGSLPAAELAQYLAESQHARDLIAEAAKWVQVAMLEPALEPVMDRYDAYVAADQALAEATRTALLRSTLILRTEVFPAARGD